VNVFRFEIVYCAWDGECVVRYEVYTECGSGGGARERGDACVEVGVDLLRAVGFPGCGVAG
jgi:hypothetical protein